MNILIAIADLGLGGAQKVAISLANGLAKKHRVFLYDLSPEKRKSEFISEISDKVSLLNYQLSFIEKIFLRMAYAVLRLFSISKEYEIKLTYLEKQWFIKRFVRGNKIEIINTHMWWADKFIADTFGNALPCPFVISSHGDHLFFSSNKNLPNYKAQLKVVFSKATEILYLSDNYLSLVKNLQIIPAPRMMKVVNGFNLVKPNNPSGGQPDKNNCTFLLASRARYDKGWKEAIDCIVSLQKNGYKECNLILAGDGEMLEEFKNKFPSNKYPFISFLGFVSDVLHQINCCDVILLPTYHQEQLPTFIIEGLFLGKPVIATDIAEIKSMITYNNEPAGTTIPLVNGKPDVKKMYDAMLELMTDKTKRKNCSEVAFNAYKKFDYDTFINQYENVFSRLIAENKIS